MNQRESFLASEGDAWFERNAAALAARDWSQDPLSQQAAQLGLPTGARVLEIGCGDGSRLKYLADAFGCRVAGIDPSHKAVAKAREQGVSAQQLTAERLPFENESFDAVLFGFCLYLCDDSDLFRIAAEADRVAARASWILIMDFDARAPLYRPYRHLPGVDSRKMDYSSMFLWHPAYTLANYAKFDHNTRLWTDDPDEWVSVACLRKHQRDR